MRLSIKYKLFFIILSAHALVYVSMYSVGYNNFARGFRECVSGPLVRSSYRAEQALAGNNAGLDNAGLVKGLAPAADAVREDRG